MNYVWKFMSNFKEFYNDINSATLTGAIDVVVVQQRDGSYLSSPFHVRFGKIGVLRSREKVVDIEINGEPVGIHMKLGESGEAFFVEETDDQVEVPDYLATSPIPDVSNFDEQMAILNADAPAEDLQFPLINSEPNNLKANLGQNQNVAESIEEIDFTDKPQSISQHGNAEIIQNEPIVTESGVTENDNSNSTKSKRKRRKRTLKRKPVSKAPEAFEKASPESAGVENSEDVGEEIFSMELDNPTEFNQVIIPPTPSPSHVSSLSSQMRTEPPEFVNKDNSWSTLSTSYEGLQLPNDRSGLSASLSDGEGTPMEGRSPSGSRPSTPKSDTEYEMRKMELSVNSEESQNQWSWTWGELPVPPQASPLVERDAPFSDDDSSTKAKQIKKDQAEQKSMLGGVFKLMGMSRNANNPNATPSAVKEEKGMYLDDLSSSDIDPEIAALYLSPNSTWTSQNKSKESAVVPVGKDEDTESGNGSSLPQSPHSVDGAIGGSQPTSADSDGEDLAGQPELKEFNDVAFSLCGNILNCSAEVAHRKFQKSIINYDQFCCDPNIFGNPDLMVRVNGKYCSWLSAAPMLMSFVLFQKPLPDSVVSDLMKEQSPKKTTKSQRRGYSWFSWRRTAAGDGEQNAANTTSLTISSTTEIVQKSEEASEELVTGAPQQLTSTPTKAVNIPSAVRPEIIQSDGKREFSKNSTPITLDKKPANSGETYKKTLRLSSEQISQLNLKHGPNEVVFSVTTAYQGTTKCKCHIYLWKYHDKIVVSDIDGTITKSDVLGHILPIIGKTWAQSGVAKLFTSISENGYHFMYLSARAIGQARVTRDYLRSIKQDDITLPDGPLLLSPSSLISALHREVIEKKPEEFKISCLKDIQALFPGNNPLYTGFGNKINDVFAYRAVGIQMSRVFTINHKGELKYELNKVFRSSYSSLRDVVDHLFPPLRKNGSDGLLTTDFVNAEEFSSFTFWRDPLPEIIISAELLAL